MKITVLTSMGVTNEDKRIGEEAMAMGHEYHFLDLNGFNFYIKNGKYESIGLTDIDSGVVIARGILSAIKPISEILKYLRTKGIRVFDNNLINHAYSINKVADLTKLTFGGIHVPDTIHIRQWEDFHESARKIGFPVIVKSTRAGRGSGVYKADNEENLTELITKLEENDKRAKNYLIQEFIPYVHDIRALIIGDDLWAMKRIPHEGEFRANFSLGGDVEKFDLSDKDKKLAREALSVIGMPCGGVDILITGDGRRYILEVNHTAGMTGMEKAQGQNIVKKYLEFAIANAV